MLHRTSFVAVVAVKLRDRQVRPENRAGAACGVLARFFIESKVAFTGGAEAVVVPAEEAR